MGAATLQCQLSRLQVTIQLTIQRLYECEGISMQNAHYFLLVLDPAKKELAVTGFEREKLEDAQKAYAEAERRVKEKLATDAVLVSVDSISSLSRAYPNYYADTSMFLTLLNEALNGLRHG